MGTGYRLIRLSHRDADVTREKRILRIFASLRPWLVIHSAAYTDVDGCESNPEKAFAVNALGTLNIVKAAKKTHSIVLYLSTDYVFAGRKKSPYREEDAAHPVSIYGKSKLKGEEFIRKLLKRYVIIRTSWLFGCGRSTFINTVLKQARKRRALKIIAEKYSSPTYAADLAEAIGRVIDGINSKSWQDKFYGTYHITNSGFCSWYDYAQYILQVKGISNVKILPISLADMKFKARRPVFSALDNSKYAGLTGKPMRSWQEAVKEFAA
ncbi:MAG: dTDP-4-dehydrorhamnose reductase [Omnitrophica WOR_2 bacterium RIFCSPHIGHO2_02_FULL_46_37]|nr:MAG: dTDP-4-dehydrorhamnose reductase [Omnitrophica WOR_2 bacterium RIFCSPHIGHO2_02_FULL_46_37]